jgi:hypothetical protein
MFLAVNLTWPPIKLQYYEKSPIGIALDESPSNIKYMVAQENVVFKVHDIIGFGGTRYRFMLYANGNWEYLEGNEQRSSLSKFSKTELQEFLQFIAANNICQLESIENVAKDASIVRLETYCDGTQKQLIIRGDHEFAKLLRQRIGDLVAGSISK